MPRRHECHTAEFKARIAIEALSGERVSADLAREYGVTVDQVERWKGSLIENAPRCFEELGMRAFEHEIEVIELFRRLSMSRGG